MTKAVELLAPARDLECGLVAIDSGADAVYIGPPSFGARARAGNSLQDIAALVRHAHTYWARVYVTINTLLDDNELTQAVALVHQLYNAGVDAVIIQDVGLLECDLPPIAIIASTQMHNHTPQRVAFLEQIGIQRVILARELSLDQIRAIRQHTTIELESFVHGALCVSYSGQCYMSYAIGGRSGNRGECAQPCRRRYTLVDRDGKVLVKDRYLLSLHDLNLTEHIGDLLDAGVTAFKIEGRLKDKAYVTNVVSWYRRQIDSALADRGWARTSSGESSIAFEPDVTKTFNRGFTTYFLGGRQEPPGAIDSPKMIGEYLGRVSQVYQQGFDLATKRSLNSRDGLCWFDDQDKLTGTTVNATRQIPDGLHVTPARNSGLRPGSEIYRNHDHAFLRTVERALPERSLAVRLRLESTPVGFALHAHDGDGNTATATLEMDKELAHQPHKAEATARKQLAKTGDTPFACHRVDLAWDQPYFVRVSALNALRRDALALLLQARTYNRPLLSGGIVSNDVPYPETRLTYKGNALNRKAIAFYERHGVEHIEPAAESGLDMTGRVVMRTRHCLMHQLGLCDGTRAAHREMREPLYLVDTDGHRYQLRFDCAACEMEVLY